jgi:hypothetical protein
MMKEEYISDSEIRVIGNTNEPKRKPTSKRKWWVFVIPVVLLIGILIFLFLFVRQQEPAPIEEVEPELFEQSQPVNVPNPLRPWLNSLDTITSVGTIIKDTSVNDIPLRIYMPLNSTPHLEIGYNVAHSAKQNILFFQAADVRADNGKIVGAFVLKGKPLSWGLSKKGFCAIIDKQVTVGVMDNSPLFEMSTECNGDFFRQYPLVDKGQLVENELKNKAIRRALCDVDGYIAVLETQSKESLHDFAQALVDIGVDNAIYLVGGTAMGWAMDEKGNGTKMGIWDGHKIKNISFIVWRR